MDWVNKRSDFQSRIDILAQQDITGIITELKLKVAEYIRITTPATSGSTISTPDITRIVELKKKIDDIKNKYLDLNNDINTFIITKSRDTNISGLVSQNGELQKQIHKLEKIQTEMNTDVESAIARDDLLRSRDTNTSRHKLFMLDRPLRKGLIPYLWVLGILFIGVGLIILKFTFPLFTVNATLSSIFGIMVYYVGNKSVIGILLVSAIIVIILLSSQLHEYVYKK